MDDFIHNYIKPMLLILLFGFGLIVYYLFSIHDYVYGTVYIFIYVVLAGSYIFFPKEPPKS